MEQRRNEGGGQAPSTNAKDFDLGGESTGKEGYQQNFIAFAPLDVF